MFRHKGSQRTLQHNLRLASLLSFVAGMVNVVGFLAVARLTTNVTGHFAFFVDELFKLNFTQGLVYLLYIFFFFLGSFTSSFLTELLHKRTPGNEYIIPALFESLILFIAAAIGHLLVTTYPNALAFLLLFAMGLQNSLVTKISNAAVRTTHLTGLFTDLGIELSQLFFYKQTEQRDKLFSSIRLRLTIIGFFFIGGVIGGICYATIPAVCLLITATTLLLGVVYDHLKFKAFSQS